MLQGTIEFPAYEQLNFPFLLTLKKQIKKYSYNFEPLLPLMRVPFSYKIGTF